MTVRFWFSRETKQWRWTVSGPGVKNKHEAGSDRDLDVALNQLKVVMVESAIDSMEDITCYDPLG